jgi:hypothetical protein
MNSHRGRSILSALLVSCTVMFVCVSCGTHTQPARTLKLAALQIKQGCQAQSTPVIVTLGVAGGNVSIDNPVVLLCQNDTLLWQKNSSISSFDVDFRSSTPFKESNGTTYVFHFDESDTTPATVPSGSAPPDTFVDYKYGVTVRDTSGKPAHIDPHVIIMGN